MKATVSFSIWVATAASLLDVVAAIDKPGESVLSILSANKVSTINDIVGDRRVEESTAMTIQRNSPHQDPREGAHKLSSMSKAFESEPNSLKIDWNKIDFETQLMFTRNHNGGRRAQESTACDFEKQAYVNCIPTLSCAECLDGAFEDAINQLGDSFTCYDVAIEMCAVAPSCACGCESEAETFYRCLVEDVTEGSCIFVDCDLVNDLPPEDDNPPPDDTAPDCSSEMDTAANCLGTLTLSCGNCVDGALQDLFAGSDTAPCILIESTVCTAIYDTCGCGSCTTEVEAAYNCLYLDGACVGIDCPDPTPPTPPTPPPTPPTPPPPPPPDCSSEINIADNCLGTLTLSCFGCVDGAIDDLFAGSDTAPCILIDSTVCTAIYDTCGCGSCTTEVEAAYNCLYLEGACVGIDCPDPTPPTPPPTPPTPPPPPDCSSEINIADNCLGTLASSCFGCVDGTIENLFAISDTVSCNTFDSKTCMAIYNICDCGSCTTDVEAVYHCLNLDTDCLGLDCEDVIDPTEPPVKPTPPPTDPEPIPGEGEQTQATQEPTPGNNLPIIPGPDPRPEPISDPSGASTASCYMMLITGILAAVTFLW